MGVKNGNKFNVILLDKKNEKYKKDNQTTKTK